jgi:hypothetical protein
VQIDHSSTPGGWRLVSALKAKQANFVISPGWNAKKGLPTKRHRSARESGRQVECPYRGSDNASALCAGSDIPISPCYDKLASNFDLIVSFRPLKEAEQGLRRLPVIGISATPRNKVKRCRLDPIA